MSIFSGINKAFGQKPSHKGGPLTRETPSGSPQSRQNAPDRPATYSKVFRWRLPDGQREEPKSVELVGSFTDWQRVPMHRDSAVDAWHTTIHHIPGNKTHHYVFLVDGKPVQDRYCDGLAVPANVQEEQFKLVTDRGPRVCMLFAQAK